jgi:hypothetical protein
MSDSVQIAPKRCLTCKSPLVASERFACSTCISRVKTATTTGLKFGAHVLAAAAGDALRREMPGTFRTLEQGYRSWRAAERKRDGAPTSSSSAERTVVDLGAARARKAGG